MAEVGKSTISAVGVEGRENRAAQGDWSALDCIRSPKGGRMLLRGAGGAQKLKSACGLCDLEISRSRRAEDGFWVACLCKLQFSLEMSVGYFLYVGIALVLLCFIFIFSGTAVFMSIRFLGSKS